jgi:DNA-binding PadR family transcriptional regulator
VATNNLFRGLIRLHVLYHATREPIFGQAIIDELGRHGYRVSPGTMYPILHGLERDRLLKSREERKDGRIRRTYAATATGRAALREAKVKVRELFHEIFEDELASESAARPRKRGNGRASTARTA